ncbi:hypothetical protein BK799_30830 [Rhodococcus sp. D-1]|nr:hypothetical protein BK799_30830 [Rhodococcus sp. D-1]
MLTAVTDLFDKVASIAVKPTVFRLVTRMETTLAANQSLSVDYRALCVHAGRRGEHARNGLKRV